MNNSPTIAIIALSVTTVTTVLLFVVQTWHQARSQRHDSRAQLVSEVISTMERSVRPFARPALLRPWARPEFEFIVAIPRLILNLEKRDAVVGQWAMTQTQMMRIATTDRGSMQIGITMAVRLTEWHQGERDRNWFVGELEASSARPGAKVPTTATWRRTLSRIKERSFEALTVVLTIIPSAAAFAWMAYSPARYSQRR